MLPFISNCKLRFESRNLIIAKQLHRCFSTSEKQKLKVCVIGSGPAGFYTTETLIKKHQNVEVDMFEKLPVPFGLVRFGVSPDHPEVKVVNNKFEQLISESGRANWYGNIEIGKDISLEDLRNNYHILVFAYGAQGDRTLGIPGENLEGVYSAKDFVAWLNGHPEHRTNTFQLQTKNAVIIGHGNVGLDVSRMLLKNIDELASTDITKEALELLKSSQIKNVQLIGRRGVAQASFTTGELREVLSIPYVKTFAVKSEIEINSESQEELNLERGKKRMAELLSKKAAIVNAFDLETVQSEKNLAIRFLLSPIRFVADSSNKKVVGIEFEKNRLEGKAGNQRAVGTGERIVIPCGAVFRSIGYKSIEIPGLPFDVKRQTVRHSGGRVVDEKGNAVSGIYATGWVKRGPSGIIGTNKICAEETVGSILHDLGALGTIGDKPGFAGIRKTLKDKRIVTFSDWKKIDAEEERLGALSGKPREKIVSVKEMFQLLNK